MRRLALSVGALTLLASGAERCHGQGARLQVEAVEFSDRVIYHSPETPGYTSWVGSWQLPDGRLRCDFRQLTGPRDRPLSTVPVLESKDGGVTWVCLTASTPGAALPPADYYQVSPEACRGMVVLADGTLVRPVWPPAALEASGSVRRSTDGGKTWSADISLLPVAEYRTWPTLIRVLADGRLVLFAGCWQRGDTTHGNAMNPNLAKMMFLSADRGVTWSAPIPLMPTAVGVCEESDVCELPNGDLFWIHRAEHFPGQPTEIPALGARMGPTPPESYWYSDRLQSIARKQGETFIPGPCSAAPFPHSGYPAVLSTQEGLILHLGTDGVHWTADTGRTWSRLEVPGTPYYPKALQRADGTILCIGHRGSDDVYGSVDQAVVQQTFRLRVKPAP